MLSLNPQSVSLLGAALTDVASIAIDRRAIRTAEEHSDLGPYCVFADIPQQRVTITITRAINNPEPPPPPPGSQGQLSFTAATSASDDAPRRTYTATVVLTAIDHDLSSAKGATQRIACLAISPDGATDPVATA